MKLTAYSKYKKTDVGWVNDIPEHWNACPNRALFKEQIRIGYNIEQLLSVTISRGIITQADLIQNTSKKDSSNLDKQKYKLVEPSDIAYNKMRAWQGAIGISKYRGIVSPAYIVLSPLVNLNPKYYHYLMRTPEFVRVIQKWSYGITSDQWSLRPEHFRLISNCVPPIEEQIKIVRYLDYKNYQINKYILIKKRQIELLKELMQVIISDAVTGKIDVHTGKPYSNYIDSGTEWMRLVPKEWDLLRIKHICNVIRGKFSHRPRNDPSLYDGEYPFIQTGDIAQASKYVTTFHQTLNAKGFAVSKEFPKGTLTMTIAANIGEVAILDFKACFPDSIVGFVPYRFVNIDYLYYLFVAMKPELIKQAPVNTQGNLNIERISTLRVVLPQVDLQKDIVRNIESRITSIEKSIKLVNNEIRILRELRTRLISDVVTGRLDVRDVEVPILTDDELEPEIDPDEEPVEECLNAD